MKQLPLIALWLTPLSSRGVEGLEIRVQGTDVVLEWPSTPGETYLLTYRPTYETNDVWGWLSTNWPAATGTNRTSFVHTNGADCPGGGSMMMAGGGGSSAAKESALKTESTTEEYQFPPLPWSAKAQSQIALTYPGLLPLLPWTEKMQEEIVQRHEEFKSLLAQEQGASMMMSGGCVPAGFYKVVREGVWIESITNNTVVSDLLLVPAEVGVVTDTIVELALLVDGVAFPGQHTTTIKPLESRELLLDTTRLPNGCHTIQVQATVYRAEPADYAGGIYDTLTSPPVTIVNSNIFTYVDWAADFVGTNCWFTLQSAIAPAAWQLSILDTNQSVVRTLSGTTTDGLIDVLWDQKDSNGNVVNQDQFETSISVTSMVSTAAAARRNPPVVRTTENWTNDGRWIVVRMNWITNSALENVAEFYDILDTSYFNLGVQDGVLPPIPPRQSGLPYFVSDPVGKTDAELRAEWAPVHAAVSNSPARNFIYIGHGGGSGLARRMFSSEDVASYLQTFDPRHPKHRRYRFVCLDGCGTATGNWAERFGIIPRPDQPLSVYQRSGKRPGAFMGFANTIYAYYSGTQLDLDYPYYRSEWVFNWMFLDRTLKQAHEEADQAVPEPFPDFLNHTTLVLLGYTNLRHREYNAAGNWP